MTETLEQPTHVQRVNRVPELVVSRFCEDLSWLDWVPDSIKVTIYDKSTARNGATRDRIHLGGWSSADGPPSAPLWPGAIELDNVGCESHSHMHHIVEHWGRLADTTVFLSGDAPGHIADIVQRMLGDLSRGERYVPYGNPHECDQQGLPHVNNQEFPQLLEGWRLFFGNVPPPTTFHWHGYGMYLVGRERIERFSLEQWTQARDWCQRKIHSLAMERLYDTMFG